MKVVIPGGLGTRMSEYTKTIPKPMVRIKKTNTCTYHGTLLFFWF